MQNLSKYVQIGEHNGEGYSRVVEYDNWTAALINYAPRFDEKNFEYVERHNKTDEVFILIEGTATLILGEVDNLQHLSMEKFKFYNIKKGKWHNIFLKENAKVIIVENSDTGKENTEYHYFK